MFWAIILSILSVAFAGVAVIGAGLVIYTFGAYPTIPKLNWFAVMMVALNVGAAIMEWKSGSLNNTVYAFAAAVINLCVYFNLDQLQFWFRRLF